jgi:hypothetical protein
MVQLADMEQQPGNSQRGQPAALNDRLVRSRSRFRIGMLITAACIAAIHFFLIWLLAPLQGPQLLLLFPTICAVSSSGEADIVVLFIATSCCWGMAIAYILYRLKPMNGRKRLLVGGMAVLLVLWSSLALLGRYRAERQAAALVSQARRDVNPSFTYLDARQWLERHGFFVFGTSGNGPSGSETVTVGADAGEYSIVTGFQVAAGGPLSGERWIEMDFRFTTDDKFKDIEMDAHHRPSPLQRRARAAARNSTQESTQQAPQH